MFFLWFLLFSSAFASHPSKEFDAEGKAIQPLHIEVEDAFWSSIESSEMMDKVQFLYEFGFNPFELTFNHALFPR